MKGACHFGLIIIIIIIAFVLFTFKCILTCQKRQLAIHIHLLVKEEIKSRFFSQ